MSNVTVFEPLFRLQWKSTKWPLLILLPLCFGLPILAVQFAIRIASGAFSDPAHDIINVLDLWSPVFPVLAAITGATFALAAWVWDHNTNHVYALSLPVERWRYALAKMASGAVLLVALSVAVLIGSLLATITVEIPETLRTYPFSFGFRFLVGALIVYSIMFAFAAGTIRTTVRILIATSVIIIFGSLAVSALNDAFNTEFPSIFEVLVSALSEWPGPFHVFGGSWMLIDV